MKIDKEKILELAYKIKNSNEFVKILEDQLKDEMNLDKERADWFLNVGGIVFYTYFDHAIHVFNCALKYCERTTYQYGEKACHINLGAAYRFTGEYDNALEHLEKALKICIGEKDIENESKCYGNLGTIYRIRGDYSKAIECQKKLVNISINGNDKSILAKGYLSLGILYRDQDDLQQAIDHFEKALNICIDGGYTDVKSSCHINIGVLLNLTRHHSTALEHLEKALKICTSEKNRYGESVCYGNMGFAYSFSSYGKAIVNFEKALKICIDLGDKESELRGHVGLGKVYHDIRMHLKAVEHYVKAIEIHEKLGKKIVEENNRIIFYGKIISLYEQVIKTYIILRDIQKAFEYVERSKSKSFIDLMSTSSITIHSDDDHIKSLLEHEAILIQRRRALNQGEKAHLGEQDKIADDLLQIYSELEKKGFEQYVSLRRPKASSLQEIQSYLKKDDVLVEYYTTENKILAFVITPTSLTLSTEIPLDEFVKYNENFKTEIENCIQIIKDEKLDEQQTLSSLNDNASIMKEIMNKMGTILLEPVSQYITNAKMVYIVPHGLLHSIPIHALTINGEPLVKTKPVSYLPSASILQFLHKREEIQFKDFVGFSSEFNEEVELVAKLFGVTAHTNVTKDTVLDKLQKKRDIIHFSCHGIFGNMLKDDLQDYLIQKGKLKEKLEPTPLNSFLLFDDGVLTANEIFNLKMDANLVTLSACDTGQNQISSGDELIGLVRAILYSRASSVIVSLWPADQIAAQNIMQNLYTELKTEDKNNSGRIASALQKAQKIAMNSNDSHPFFWAPFVLIGNP